MRRFSADEAGKDVVFSESAKVYSNLSSKAIAREKYHRLTTYRVSYVE
ncbi:MAG: hypothetical protein RIR12_1153 [Bacteroidota bacterium]|jgi:hypothetical protein